MQLSLLLVEEGVVIATRGLAVPRGTTVHVHTWSHVAPMKPWPGILCRSGHVRELGADSQHDHSRNLTQNPNM